MAGERTAETLVGAAVLGAATLFLTYALGVGGIGGGGGYQVTARFGQVGGLTPGADVRLAGVKVGTVEAITLDPQTYLAVAEISMNRDVKVPATQRPRSLRRPARRLASGDRARRLAREPAARAAPSRTPRARWTCSA
jgi:hypothetical protein